MSQIILNGDQVRTLEAATNTVEIRDIDGRLLGYVSPVPTAAVIAEAKRRAASSGPWRTSEEVMARLDAAGKE